MNLSAAYRTVTHGYRRNDLISVGGGIVRAPDGSYHATGEKLRQLREIRAEAKQTNQKVTENE